VTYPTVTLLMILGVLWRSFQLLATTPKPVAKIYTYRIWPIRSKL